MGPFSFYKPRVGPCSFCGPSMCLYTRRQSPSPPSRIAIQCPAHMQHPTEPCSGRNALLDLEPVYLSDDPQFLSELYESSDEDEPTPLVCEACTLSSQSCPCAHEPDCEVRTYGKTLGLFRKDGTCTYCEITRNFVKTTGSAKMPRCGPR